MRVTRKKRGPRRPVKITHRQVKTTCGRSILASTPLALVKKKLSKAKQRLEAWRLAAENARLRSKIEVHSRAKVLNIPLEELPIRRAAIEVLHQHLQTPRAQPFTAQFNTGAC